MKRDGKDNLMKCATILIWLAVWAILSIVVGSELILPGPAATVKAMFSLIQKEGFWLDVFSTMLRVMLGASISLAAGAAAAAFASRSRMLRELLSLPVSFFKSIPVMAIIIYVILIVKADWVAVVVCVLMCFPIAYTNMLSGIMSKSVQLEELSEVLGFTARQKWRIVDRPELQSQISASVNLIMSMSWKVVVAAEVLAIPGHSIGYQMLNSKYYLETPDLFAYMIVLIVLSIAAERAAAYLTEYDFLATGKRVRNEVERVVSAAVIEERSGPGSELKPELQPELQHEAEREPQQDIQSELHPDVHPNLQPVIITLADVHKSYVSEDGTVKDVLTGLSLEFIQRIVALRGPSGKGKTTVARLIMGLEKPDKGTVSIRPYMKPDVLFQEDRLLPWLTAEENMMLAFIGQRTEACKEKDPVSAIKKIAEKMEISDELDKKPSELSGGMAHRVALGRALLGGSRLLILDEPMRGIDEALKKRLTAKLEEYIRYDRSGAERMVVLITHDEELASELADVTVELM